jgi:hypothetical protein
VPPPKTFNAGDVLTAADLNTNMIQPGTSSTGTRIVAGQTAYTISAVNGVQITISYGMTFSSLTALLLSVKSGSNIPLVAYHNGAPGNSSAAVRVETPGGGTTTVSGFIHWLAIGTP